MQSTRTIPLKSPQSMVHFLTSKTEMHVAPCILNPERGPELESLYSCACTLQLIFTLWYCPALVLSGHNILFVVQQFSLICVNLRQYLILICLTWKAFYNTRRHQNSNLISDHLLFLDSVWLLLYQLKHMVSSLVEQTKLYVWSIVIATV